MKQATAARRWAKDLFRRFERHEVEAAHVSSLFSAITAEARADLSMEVAVALDELRDAYRFEAEFMPPCRFRFYRFLAIFLHLRSELEELRAFQPFTSDSAWDCPCASCTAFADRVDATLRRWAAADDEPAHHAPSEYVAESRAARIARKRRDRVELPLLRKADEDLLRRERRRR